MNVVDEFKSLFTYHYCATQSEIDSICKRQRLLLGEVEKAWFRFLPWFKQRCREFSDRVDPGFEPLLQKLLLGENWTFPNKWEELFYVQHEFIHDRPGYPLIERWSIQLHPRKGRNDKIGFVIPKINVLAHPEECTRDLLTSLYACYEKLPRGAAQGLFDVVVTWEDIFDYVCEAHRIALLAGGKFHLLFNLDRQVLQNFRYQVLQDSVPAARKREHNPAPDKKLRENNLLFIKDTPFEVCVPKSVKFDIPLDARIAHTDICAGTGHGKTQLVQSFIADILPRYGFLVMDSQGALIAKILELKPLLQRDVIYINPEDKEYIPGITFFGVNLEAIQDDEKVYNTLISFYENIFNDLMGSGLTEKQSGMFGYLAQLLLTIPKATIFTFIDVLVNGEKYREKMQKLPQTQRYFFENLFFDKSYGHTKGEIARKLLGLVKTPTIDRILNNTEQKIDFYKAMNEGAIILINTAKDHLGEVLSSFFGKFLLGMLYTNVMKRDPNGRDPPFFFFLDEAQEYFLKGMAVMFSQFRKFNVGLTIAHQNLNQLKEKGIDADVRASTDVKIVGTPNKEDKVVWASEMRTDTDFLDNCLKYQEQQYSEWACFVKHRTRKAVKIKAPWFALNAFSKMTAEEQKTLLERNRRKYCVKVSGGEDPQPGSPGKPPDEPGKPAEPNKPKEPPKKKPQDDDDYFA
jgi:hypothetical protein